MHGPRNKDGTKDGETTAKTRNIYLGEHTKQRTSARETESRSTAAGYGKQAPRAQVKKESITRGRTATSVALLEGSQNSTAVIGKS
jgi:hypothetical protein